MTTQELIQKLQTLDPSGEPEDETFDSQGNKCEPYEVVLLTFDE